MNKYISLTNGDNGFTLMETLASITVILIISGCVFLVFSTSLKSISKVHRTVDTALKILTIDRFIREETNNFHISYWTNAPSQIDVFRDNLLRSPYGRYIRQFELIKSPAGITRGIRVVYSVDITTAHTDAIFPSTPVLENMK